MLNKFLFPLVKNAEDKFIRRGFSDLITNMNNTMRKRSVDYVQNPGSWRGSTIYKGSPVFEKKFDALSNTKIPDVRQYVSDAVNTGTINGVKLSANERRRLAMQSEAMRRVIENPGLPSEDFIGRAEFTPLEDKVRSLWWKGRDALDKLGISSSSNIGVIRDTLQNPTLFTSFTPEEEAAAKVALKRMEFVDNRNKGIYSEARGRFNENDFKDNVLEQANWRNDMIGGMFKNPKDLYVDDLQRAQEAFARTGYDVEAGDIIKNIMDKFPRWSSQNSTSDIAQLSIGIKSLTPSQKETAIALLQGWEGTMPELIATARLL